MQGSGQGLLPSLASSCVKQLAMILSVQCTLHPVPMWSRFGKLLHDEAAVVTLCPLSLAQSAWPYAVTWGHVVTRTLSHGLGFGVLKVGGG